MDDFPAHYEYVVDQEYRDVTLCGEEQVQLLLYIRSTCPYCQRVTNYLRSIDKTIPIKDIGKDPNAAKELVLIGGKRQVPCLIIDGKPLYESADIVEWLEKNQDKY